MSAGIINNIVGIVPRDVVGKGGGRPINIDNTIRWSPATEGVIAAVQVCA
jgi:hypothetical protein